MRFAQKAKASALQKLCQSFVGAARLPAAFRSFGDLMGGEPKDCQIPYGSFALFCSRIRVNTMRFAQKAKASALQRLCQSFVGAARFELATSWSQTRRDDRATLRPELFVHRAAKVRVRRQLKKRSEQLIIAFPLSEKNSLGFEL
jgi:hypothetical protein